MARKRFILQESDSATLPAEYRKMFDLKPGDEISFVETDDGLLISPREALLNRLLDEVGEDLRARGITLEGLMHSGHNMRDNLLKEFYRIKPLK